LHYFAHIINESVPKKSPTTSTTMSFRLPVADRQWLSETARANGVEEAQIIRWALESLRQYVEQHGGRLHLPINIRELWILAQPVAPTAEQPESAPPAKRKGA
jgi:hypothetical protein